MGFKDRREGRRGIRDVATIVERLRFLIVCEGMKTEPNYFRSFRVNVDVEIEPAAGNTLSVVRRADELAKKEKYDQIWCVFDRDSFPAADFDNAISSARSKGFRVAYSNEAFEIWYLLHFDNHVAALPRHQYWPILTSRLGKKYAKNSTEIYSDLQGSVQLAIRRAKRILSEYDPHVPSKDNPSTTVFELVEELLANALP